MSTWDLHFYRPPTSIVQHEQSILDRASARSEIDLLYQAAQVDILDWMVVVEIDVLAWHRHELSMRLVCMRDKTKSGKGRKERVK
jgi:hypothetical protein